MDMMKTASEYVRRQEQQEYARLHQSVTVTVAGARWRVNLDIVPDEYEPYAHLSAFDEFGDELARVRVRPDFKLNAASAGAWVDAGYPRPGD